MNNENKYIKPELTVISLDDADIICASNSFGHQEDPTFGDFWHDSI